MMVRPGGATRLPHCGLPSTRDPALTTRPVQPCSEVQAALSAKRPPLLLTSAASSGVPRPTRSFSRSTHRTHLKAVTLMVTSYLSGRARLQEETRGTGSARVPWVESRVVLPAGATDHTHFPNHPHGARPARGCPLSLGSEPVWAWARGPGLLAFAPLEVELTAVARVLPWCPTLCGPVDCRPPGSSVHGILQAGTLEWVAMPSSRDLPDPGIQAASVMSPALAGETFAASASWEALWPKASPESLC